MDSKGAVEFKMAAGEDQRDVLIKDKEQESNEAEVEVEKKIKADEMEVLNKEQVEFISSNA